MCINYYMYEHEPGATTHDARRTRTTDVQDENLIIWQYRIRRSNLSGTLTGTTYYYGLCTGVHEAHGTTDEDDENV